MTSEIHASREYLMSMSIWYYCIIDPAEVAVPQLLFGRALIKRICDAASAWRRGYPCNMEYASSTDQNVIISQPSS